MWCRRTEIPSLWSWQMSPRPFTPTIEETLSQMAKRVRHLETAEKWQLANIRVADHFATQGDGSLGNPWSGPGDNLFSTPMQKAADALPAAGGVVYIKAGHYMEQKKDTTSALYPIYIQNRHNITFWAEPGAVLHYDCTLAATPHWAISVRGSKDALTSNLAFNVSPGAWTVTVVAAAGFAVGDYIMLEDTRLFGSIVLAGEIHQIRSIAGNVLTLQEPAWDAYTVARTGKVTKLFLCENIQFHNLTIIGNNGAKDQDGIYTNYVNKLLVNNVKVQDCVGKTGITIGSGNHSRVINPEIINVGVNGYGISLVYACQYPTVEGGSTKYSRHGIVFGGSTQIPGRPREGLVDNHESDYAHNSAFDVHAGTDNVTLRDCIARNNGIEYGYKIRGNTAWLENCKVVNGDGGGIIFGNLTDQPTNIAVIGGSIETLGFGIQIIESSAVYGGWACVPHECESVRIEGVDMKPGSDGIVYNCGPSPVDTDLLAIVGNTIKIAGATTGIRVQRLKCGSIGDNAIRGGGANSIGIDLQDVTQHVSVKGNAVHLGRNAGTIGVKYAGSRNLVVGNNLYQTAAALSDVGVNNQSAANLLETGLLG